MVDCFVLFFFQQEHKPKSHSKELAGSRNTAEALGPNTWVQLIQKPGKSLQGQPPLSSQHHSWSEQAGFRTSLVAHTCDVATTARGLYSVTLNASIASHLKEQQGHGSVTNSSRLLVYAIMPEWNMDSEPLFCWLSGAFCSEPELQKLLTGLWWNTFWLWWKVVQLIWGYI